MSIRDLTHVVVASLLALSGVSAACGGSPLPGPSVALTLVSVFPNTGPTGGSQIRIDGTGFQSGATVTMDGLAAIVTAVGSTSVTATAPSHTPATVDVVVTNPDGQSVRLTGGYTYVPLTVTAITPTAGLIGDSIRVEGTGFVSGSILTLDGVAAGVTTVNSTTILAVAPSHSPGPVDVAVTTPAGQGAVRPAGYTYGVMTLTVTPTLVSAGGALTVTWTAPNERSSDEGIGLYRPGVSDASWFGFLHSKGGVSDTFIVTAPTEPGEYELRYLTSHGAAARASFSVSASASP